MAHRRVVVTGLGCISPYGVGVDTLWAGLLSGKSAIGLIPEDLSQSSPSLPCRVAAAVPSSENVFNGWDSKNTVTRETARTTALYAQYALHAADQAIRDADLRPESMSQDLLDSVGVCIGSGIGSLHDFYDSSKLLNEGLMRKISPYFVPKILVNMAPGLVSIKYGFRGPNHSASTACTTGSHSIGDAARFIKYSDANVMIAGSSEASIHALAFAGFSKANSLCTKFNDCPEKASRPFDRDRAGFVLGEGAGVIVLEELEFARARNARIYCELKGYGLSADAHHITAPQPDGQGAYLSMTRALKDAKLGPGDIQYVNAHATGTAVGDKVEVKAINRLIEDSTSEIHVSSIKGSTGHLLGGAGSVEAIASIMSLQKQCVPATLNLEHFACDTHSRVHYPSNHKEIEISACLSNSFGFGGTNATLCFTSV